MRVTTYEVVNEIARERERQLDHEGYDYGHDDEHTGGDLAWAAAAYCVGDEDIARTMLWPWDDDQFKPKSYRENLVRAAALIVAEIQRLDRAQR